MHGGHKTENLLFLLLWVLLFLFNLFQGYSQMLESKLRPRNCVAVTLTINRLEKRADQFFKIT